MKSVSDSGGLKVQYVRIVFANIQKCTELNKRMRRKNSFDVMSKMSLYCLTEISIEVSMLTS